MKSVKQELQERVTHWEEHLKRAQELNTPAEIQFAKIMLKEYQEKLMAWSK